jgi:hypothetical protein
MARRTGRSPDWLRDHYRILGGLKEGGPKAPIYFNMAVYREQLRDRAGGNGRTPAPQPKRPRSRQRRPKSDVPLLPIRETQS